MSKKVEKLDVELRLNCSGNFRAEQVMLSKAQSRQPEAKVDEFQISALIADSLKDAISESGLSRDNVVDGVNTFFGRTKHGAEACFPTCRNPLTIHMLNNYLSKPLQYPVPAYYLVAVQRVTSSLAPVRALAEYEGGQVVTGVEVENLVYGTLERQIAEAKTMQRKIIEGETTWLLN